MVVNGYPLILYQFKHSLGAAEYVYAEPHSRQFAWYTVTSDPDRIFADNAQLELLSDRDIPWSPLIDDPAFVDRLTAATAEESEGSGSSSAGLQDLLNALKRNEYRVRLIQQLEGRRLYPHCKNGYEIFLNDDPFLIYRFCNTARASDFATNCGHALSAGPFVLRSDPANQYTSRGLQTTNAPEDKVSWSPLIEDQELAAFVRDFAGA
jgi:hypothetical protein